MDVTWRETRSWRANTHTGFAQCGENDGGGGGGGGGMKEFAGTMRHRESAGETVSLAQLGRTRAPLYSASLPLRGPTKAFLVFDTTILVALCVSSSLPPVLLSIAFSPLCFSRHPSARNKPRDYRCAGLREKEKQQGGCAHKVTTAAHSLPLSPVQRLGRVRRTQPF